MLHAGKPMRRTSAANSMALLDHDQFASPDYSDEVRLASKMRRVSLVDDDSDYGYLFEAAGKKFNLNLNIYNTSSEFLSGFAASPAAVALIDLEMTDLFGVAWKFAGVSTVIEFRRRFGFAPKVWVVTGVADNPNLIAACLNAGADDFIWKDMDVSEICRKVSGALDRG